MPVTCHIIRNPWKPIKFGLFLGVCVFFALGVVRVLALDANSSLFGQNQPSTAVGDKTNQPLALPEESPNPSPSLFSTFLRLVLALAIVIGLVYLTVWGLKILWEKKGWNQITDEGKPLKILTSTFLAPRKSIYLVEIGKRILVIGVGNEELNCLDIIREPEEVELVKSSLQQGFPNVFNRIMKKQETADQEEETSRIIKESTQAVGDYVEKLKKMSVKSKKNTDDSPDGKQ